MWELKGVKFCKPTKKPHLTQTMWPTDFQRLENHNEPFRNVFADLQMFLQILPFQSMVYDAVVENMHEITKTCQPTHVSVRSCRHWKVKEKTRGKKKKTSQKAKSSSGHFKCLQLQMQRMSNLVWSVKLVRKWTHIHNTHTRTHTYARWESKARTQTPALCNGCIFQRCVTFKAKTLRCAIIYSLRNVYL